MLKNLFRCQRLSKKCQSNVRIYWSRWQKETSIAPPQISFCVRKEKNLENFITFCCMYGCCHRNAKGRAHRDISFDLNKLSPWHFRWRIFYALNMNNPHSSVLCTKNEQCNDNPWGRETNVAKNYGIFFLTFVTRERGKISRVFESL